MTELVAEVERLRIANQDTIYENNRLGYVISAWTKSSADLKRLHEAQRPAGCKFGLGYEENSTDKSDVRIRPEGKLKRISFVKEGSADHAAYHKNSNEKDSSKTGNEISKLIYVQPTDRQSSWLKPKSRRPSQPAKGSAAQTSRRLKSKKKQTSRRLS